MPGQRRAARAAGADVAHVGQQFLDLLLVRRLESGRPVGRARRRLRRPAVPILRSAAARDEREQRECGCRARRYLRYFRGLRPYIVTTAFSRNFDMRGLYGNMWGSFFVPMRVISTDCALQYF